MEKSYFTVIMPLYNHGKYVSAAIESVINQTFSDWQLVICNDGSSDESLDVALSYSKDKRLKVISKKTNFGCPQALNSCILESNSKFICWLSSDDLYTPSKLENHFKHHNTFADDLVSIVPAAAIRGENIEVSQQFIPLNLDRVTKFLEENYINGLSPCVSKRAYINYGLFSDKYHYAVDMQRWFTLFRFIKPFFIQCEEGSYTRVGTSSQEGVNFGALVETPRMLYSELLTHNIFALCPFEYKDQIQNHEILNHIIKSLLNPANYLNRFFMTSQVEAFISNIPNKTNITPKSLIDSVESLRNHEVMGESISRIIFNIQNQNTVSQLDFFTHLQTLTPQLTEPTIREYIKNYITYRI